MYDVIGDLHGHYQALVELHPELSYHKNNHWKHERGRKLLFLGDFLDEGPMIPEIVSLVRYLCENDVADAIAGNHEFNAICFSQFDSKSGTYLREHSKKNIGQHHETLSQYADRLMEWAKDLQWLRTLPLFLETDSLRAVHACWSPSDIAVVQKYGSRPLKNTEFIRLASKSGTPEHIAVETILKGIEIGIPCQFTDHKGNSRNSVRIQWWKSKEVSEGTPLNSFLLNPHSSLDDKTVDSRFLASIPPIQSNKTTLFGHYRLKGPPKVLSEGLACLDYVDENGGHSNPTVLRLGKNGSFNESSFNRLSDFRSW